jgi:hypothetical protein
MTIDTITNEKISYIFFLICILRGGVQQGPLGTSAIYWPIVPAQGDYDDGEFGGI